MPVTPSDRSALLSRVFPADLLAKLEAKTPRQLLTERGADRALQATALSAMAADPANHALVARAQAAVARLDADPSASLSQRDLADLEAISLLVTRPAMFVRGDDVGAAPADWPQVDQRRLDIRKRVRGVGRLERDGQPCGTGFLVSAGRLLTNNHVLWCLVRKASEEHLPLSTWKADPDLFAERVAGAAATWASSRPVLELRGEDGRLDSSTVPVMSVIDRHEALDVAILAMGNTPGVEVEPLADDGAAMKPDRALYVIGYPLVQDVFPYDTPDLLRIFGPPSAWATRKRLAPGLLTSTTDQVLRHDASTLGGNSGSPVIDFATGKVVAIHKGGLPFEGNTSVPLWPLRDWALGT